MHALCDSCGKREAVVRRSYSGGEVHLCAVCLERGVAGERRGGLWWRATPDDSLLVHPRPGLTILGGGGEGEGPVCPGCGRRWSDFVHSERLGCGECYPAFAEVLERFFHFLERPGF
ncbi:MAG: hypothetical protein GF399_09940 [Candidatus Coatesbacteria bacterium]|nr:hypothetical protein [Candidatus Coatesbacteria bacterium]